MMISISDIEKMSDYECVNLISELVHRLKSTAYAHGYKDGFNDGKDAEHQKNVFVKSEGASRILSKREREQRGCGICVYVDTVDVERTRSDIPIEAQKNERLWLCWFNHCPFHNERQAESEDKE